MGKYSVPKTILQYERPKKTTVKNINGYYYVYESCSVKREDGKWHTQMGKEIGSIKEGIGFVPNKKLLCDDEITTLEFGEYAVVLANSQNTLAILKEFFNPADALQIYIVSVIHYVNGFVYMTDIKKYFDDSYLSLKYPSLKLGYDAIASLYENLGKRQNHVLEMQEKLISMCSGQIAIDGHVIGSCSQESDLVEPGYKFQKLGEPQINLLMAYDVNTGMPLASRIYNGSNPDKLSVRDFVTEVELKNVLFIVDRGFYSTDNLNLFTSNGNSYIIPLASNLKACKKAIDDLSLKNRFLYQHGDKSTVVEYKDEIIDGNRVLTFRDVNEATYTQTEYMKCIAEGKSSYTEEGFEQHKDLWGVYVLQTSLNKENRGAQEIFELYKKRWAIETFYNYLKNKADFHTLYQQDPIKMQGLAFIMLVTGMVHNEFEAAVKKVNGKNSKECLFDAHVVRANKRHGVWGLNNCTKKYMELFKLLNTPMEIQLT